MAADKPQPPTDPPLSSTLRHVQRVQREADDVSWSNLHDRIQRWVNEAATGQNLPPDRSIDDLVQEVLLQIYKDIAAFEVTPEASFSGWVRKVAMRKLNDYWRRERAQKRGRGKQRHLSDYDEIGGPDGMADESAPRQSMVARWHELDAGLQKAIGELGEKHQRVIELRMFQGLPFAEIALLLGYTKEVTVRSLYMRALQRLQVLLQDFADTVMRP